MPSEKTFEQYLAGCPAPKSLPVELVEKYQWHAMYHADQQIKKDCSSAKRTATLLTKAAHSFDQLTSKDQLALSTAAAAMRALAEDLEVLGSWAKRFNKHYERVRKADRLAHFQALAAVRWPTAAERDFELALAEELKCKDGRAAFAAWKHGRGLCLDVATDRFRFDDFKPERHDNEGDFPSPLLHLMSLGSYAFNTGARLVGPFFHIQRPAFEEYLAYRRSVAAQAHGILSAAANKTA